MSVPSGIGVSMKKLFDNKNLRVQETARALFDSWNCGRENKLDDLNAEDNGECLHSEVKPGDASGTTVETTPTVGSWCLENSAAGISPVGASVGQDDHVVNPKGLQLEITTDVKIPILNDQDPSCKNLSRIDAGRFQGDAQDVSVTPASCTPKLATVEESSLSGAGRTVFEEICSSPLAGIVKVCSPEVPSSVTLSDKAGLSPETFSNKETSPVCARIGSEDVSSANHLNPHLSVLEPPVKDTNSNESDSCLTRKSESDFDCDANTLVSKPNSEGANAFELDNSSCTVELRISAQEGALYSNSQDSSINDCNMNNSDKAEAPLHKEDVGALRDTKKPDVEPNLRVGASTIASYFSKPNDPKTLDVVGKTRLEMDLDFVVDDALEVARLVAKEVEREVVDYREPLCSTSSDKNSEVKVMQPRSPDSVNGEQDLAIAGPENEMSTDHDLPGEALSPKGDFSSNSMSMERTEDFARGQGDSLQVTEAARTPAQSIEKTFCEFDLNEEIHTDDVDHPEIPISPNIEVSASKPALDQLVEPNRFGGEHGWKGSAVTNAFCPESPCRISVEKALSVDRSCHSSKQKQNFLEIDLNDTGANNDGTCGPVLIKQTPGSGLPCGECSLEVSSRRAERLKLDLNHVSEDEDTPFSNFRMEGQASNRRGNGHYSPSLTSSSSSRLHSMLNIDLNDNPCAVDSHRQRFDLGDSSSHAFGRQEEDDPVISIMGARVATNRKEVSPQTLLYLPNGRVSEFPMSGNVARSSSAERPHFPIAYSPVPGFMYDGLSAGASSSITPFMYGATSASHAFRVDSSVPLLPHLMSSPAGVPPPYSQSPFLVGMGSMPSGFNSIGLRQPPILDLNSSWPEAGDNGHELRSLKQSFIQVPAMLDEEMRSVGRVKRKEPDSGWDSYSGVYKQRQAPWH